MFREPLPNECPPDYAEEVSGTLIFYRLVKNQTVTEGDFDSARALSPSNRFSKDECHVRGVSVFARDEDLKKISKLRRHREKRICLVVLNQGAGYIEPNGQGSHHTWWPLADYDILGSCKVL